MPAVQFFHAQSLIQPHPPAAPGCNIGFHLHDAGTGSICCFVRGLLPEDEGHTLLLSCEHVLCNNLRDRDALLDGSLRGTIEMPGPYHQARLKIDGTEIATVHRFGNVLFGGQPNRVDAAVARLEPGTQFSATTAGYSFPIVGTSAPAAGMEIMKIGSSSGLQFGRIHDDFLVNATVDYVAASTGGPLRSAYFTDVVRYRCRCDDGDSGGPVLNAHTFELVGMHFAGHGDEGLFCPIETVFAELAITL
jgi:hypothetical protein